jgi:WD40 repeat protein
MGFSRLRPVGGGERAYSLRPQTDSVDSQRSWAGRHLRRRHSQRCQASERHRPVPSLHECECVGGWSRLWDLTTGQVARQFRGHTDAISASAFSPDGQYIVTTGPDKTARLWEVATGKEVRRFGESTPELYAISFSPDGRYVVAGSDDKLAYLWDAHTGQEIRRFVGHTADVNSVGVSPDGRWLLTASSDQTARIWDLRTGLEVRRFVGYTGLWSAQFSPDGKYVLAGSADFTARLGDVDYHTTIIALCERLYRDLTDAERVAYEIKDSMPTCPKP